MKCMMTMKIMRQSQVHFVTVINTLMDGFCPPGPGYWWTHWKQARVIWRNVRDKDEPQIQAG